MFWVFSSSGMGSKIWVLEDWPVVKEYELVEASQFDTLGDFF
jgi:hypothetical protein